MITNRIPPNQGDCYICIMISPFLPSSNLHYFLVLLSHSANVHMPNADSRGRNFPKLSSGNQSTTSGRETGGNGAAAKNHGRVVADI